MHNTWELCDHADLVSDASKPPSFQRHWWIVVDVSLGQALQKNGNYAITLN